MLAATPQRTADRRRLAPTPMIAVLMVWVVLSGIPQREDVANVIEAIALKDTCSTKGGEDLS